MTAGCALSASIKTANLLLGSSSEILIGDGKSVMCVYRSRPEARRSAPQGATSSESGYGYCQPLDPTGLTIGHAFNIALIDKVVRFQRLQGKNVLCLPGTDHA